MKSFIPYLLAVLSAALMPEARAQQGDRQELQPEGVRKLTARGQSQDTYEESDRS